MRGLVAVWVSLGIVCSALVSCSPAYGGDPCDDSAASQAYPAETLQDWATYGDHLLLIRITEEQALPQAVEHRDSNRIWRRLTVTTESVVWSRPGERNRAPETQVWETIGWVTAWWRPPTRETDRLGEPSLLPGETSLLMVSEIPGLGNDLPARRWMSSSLVPVTNGIVGTGRSFCPRPATDEMTGLTVEQAVELLRRTPPDPGLPACNHLNAMQRYACIITG